MNIILCSGVTWSLVDSLVLLTKDLAMLVHCTCANIASCQPCTRSNVLLGCFTSGSLQGCRELFVAGDVISAMDAKQRILLKLLELVLCVKLLLYSGDH